MARADKQFNLRIPEELRKDIERSAKEAHRTITSEILLRLRYSLEKQTQQIATFREGEAPLEYDLESARVEKNRRAGETAPTRYSAHNLSPVEIALLRGFRALPEDKQRALLELLRKD